MPIHDALMVNRGLMIQATAEQVLKECWAEQFGVTFQPAVETESILLGCNANLPSSS